MGQVRVNVKLDEELHRRVRAEGLMAGMTLQDTVSAYTAVFAEMGHDLHREAQAAAAAAGVPFERFMRDLVADGLKGRSGRPPEPEG